MIAGAQCTKVDLHCYSPGAVGQVGHCIMLRQRANTTSREIDDVSWRVRLEYVQTGGREVEWNDNYCARRGWLEAQEKPNGGVG